ncbi:disease resistance protein RPV1 [Ricinus communis]|uniref:disease resistance protein RPV1 n=1 Tax=Ricinus communis TaxID=3988 RepID=UPI00201AA6AE|nr:disease resistance protein RPV1 [Ricinus communis]
MASTSSTPPQWKYDVFLSFRGLDTRNGFLSHLFKALREKQIIAFKDENLDRGEQISDTLSRTIEESYVLVVILSKNYVDSPWCLDELVKILQCNKEKGQVVLPVFYEIDPTEVQELTGSYADALMNHRKEFEDCLVESWSHALKEIAGMAGFVSRNMKPESKLIEEIVDHIWERLNQTFSYYHYDDGLVGINSRIKDIELILCLESKDVRILGIWGMGGIGKTTIASKIFDQISSQFERICFVANVREKLEKSTLDSLQQEILTKLLGKEYLGMPIKLSSSFIRKWITRKKVLIVLDDVNDSEQTKFLVGARDIYSPGSRIIMTSRDKQILKNGGAEIYEVKKLNYHNAFQLFILHAFKENPPAEALMEVTRMAVEYGQGIPLALKVLGSTLCDKNIKEWRDHLKKLEGISDKKIQNVLRISFDDLDEDEKEIFLDIACFFKSEDKNEVESILSSFGRSAITGIRILQDKSLITVSNEKIEMHDLLQQMGRDIVRQEGVKDPRKRSRLWNPQDIYHLLTNDLGKNISVESISLDMSQIRDIELSPAAFEEMSKLKFLRLHTTCLEPGFSYYQQNKVCHPCKRTKISLSEELSFLPNGLRYLYWYEYPSKSLPLSFCPDNLVQLHLRHSHVQQLCNSDQSFENLKVMDLSYSADLIKIPDLFKLPKLEVLRLRGCTGLVEISSSVPYGSKLSHMDLGNCENLCRFSSTLHLKNLNFLSLEGCSKITEFPKVSRNIRSLILNRTSIEQVPPSIGRCTSLTVLSLVRCTRLDSLPSSIGELKCLKQLYLRGCLELASLPNNIGDLKCLEDLSLDECSRLMDLPDDICNLKSLRNLWLSKCQRLSGLPENLGNLESLEALYVIKSGIKALPWSINGLSKLCHLFCDGCKGLLLPPFTGLSHLQQLSLEDCGMTEISDISSLVSLGSLNLGGNNLETLPTSIRQLSMLQFLALRNCKRLKCLSHLPSALQTLVMTNCTSLESMLTSPTKANTDSLCWLDTWNCVSLNQNECKKIMDDMLQRLGSILPQLKRHTILKETHHRTFQERGQCNVKVYRFNAGFRGAGGELPQRMRYQNNSGSSLLLSLRPEPHDFMFLSFCATVTFQGCYSRDFEFVECKCKFVAESRHSLCFQSKGEKRDVGEEVLGSEYSFFWHSAVHFSYSGYRFNKASFEFHPVFYHKGQTCVSSSAVVTKCGVHLLYDDNDTDNDISLSKLPWVWRSSYWRMPENIEIEEDEGEEE